MQKLLRLSWILSPCPHYRTVHIEQRFSDNMQIETQVSLYSHHDHRTHFPGFRFILTGGKDRAKRFGWLNTYRRHYVVEIGQYVLKQSRWTYCQSENTCAHHQSTYGVTFRHYTAILTQLIGATIINTHNMTACGTATCITSSRRVNILLASHKILLLSGNMIIIVRQYETV